MNIVLDPRPHHTFNAAYNDIFKSSGHNISYKEIKEYTILLDFLKTQKHKYGSISPVIINNKLILIDTQFDPGRNLGQVKSGLFNNIKPDLYVKLEPNDELEKAMKCKIRSWVMFPAGLALVDKFKYVPLKKLYNAYATSQNSMMLMKRVDWCERMNKLNTVNGLFNQTENCFEVCIKIPQSIYLEKLKKSNWGISLSIRNEKNTREYEFISNHMPLALNYEPKYGFPFNPDEHYFKLNTPDDLNKMLLTDPMRFSLKSKEIWENYFRPDKAVEWLVKLVNGP
ncbi:hypothetical protein CCP1ISM_3030002 [Azospirillaceae bacterium]